MHGILRPTDICFMPTNGAYCIINSRKKNANIWPLNCERASERENMRKNGCGQMIWWDAGLYFVRWIWWKCVCDRPVGRSFVCSEQTALLHFMSNYAARRCVCGKTINHVPLLPCAQHTSSHLSCKPAFWFRRLFSAVRFFAIENLVCACVRGASLHLCIATRCCRIAKLAFIRHNLVRTRASALSVPAQCDP